MRPGRTSTDGVATGTIENSDHDAEGMARALRAHGGRAGGGRGRAAPRGCAARGCGGAARGPGDRRRRRRMRTRWPREEARERLEAMTKWLQGETEEDEGDGSRAVTERSLLTGTSFAATGGERGRRPRVGVGPGRGVELQRALGRGHGERRGGERDAGCGLHPRPVDGGADGGRTRAATASTGARPRVRSNRR